MTFADLGVPASLTRVLAERGITQPTPIQSATLADSIAGRDVLGRGRTGSGKTYAFLLPLVTRLGRTRTTRRATRPRAIVLVPTRELAVQIDAVLKPLTATCGLRSQTVFGGVGQQPQVQALRSGVDVLVACPGRLEDLIDQGHCRLDAVEVSVLDEADHMADLGFLPAVTRLLAKTPRNGQRLFFSATLDNGIDALVRRFLDSPAVHHADSPRATQGAMAHHILHVGAAVRLDVLADLAAAPGRTVIFTRTKHRAKGLTRQLKARGVAAAELHGDLGQNARIRNMDAFHSGVVTSLVATDIAARGIHVDDVELVVHADPPVEHKAYVHRSGRTARAGKQGTVVTLMTDDQVSDVRSLVRAAGIRPTTTVVDTVAHPILRELAVGERRYDAPVAVATDRPARGQRDPRAGRSSAGRSSAARPRQDQQRRGRSAAPTAASSGPATGADRRDHSATRFSRRARTR
ncbi:DEAD/DEAH box helicase [Microlunatus ginsengisoli]